MALVTSAELYAKATQGGYAVAGFETYWLESVGTVIEMAEQCKSPVLIQVTPKRLKHLGIDYFQAVAEVAARKATVPVVIHLDHGFEFEDILMAIRHGFTSVMIDGSAYPLEENIRRTRQVVEVARPLGITVEAELGKIGGKESGISVAEARQYPTEPEEARLFVAETGVDSLAVAIGNASGFYQSEPVLDFERLKRIHEVIPVPLVLHGGSGIPAEQLRQAVGLGVRKVNVATFVKAAFVDGLREAITADPKTQDLRKILECSARRVKSVVATTFEVLGSVGKA